MVLGRLVETWPRFQNVVVVTRQTVGKLVESCAQAAFEPVPLDGAADLPGDGKAQPGTLAVRIGPRENIEDEEPRRHRAAMPVDGIEVARAGEAVPAFHHARQAERRLRPFARRRFRIARPARVDMRARNPCRRFRRRTFG
jgi:hypothetical protein